MKHAMRMCTVLLAVALPLAAQQPQRPDTGRRPMMGPGPGMMQHGGMMEHGGMMGMPHMMGPMMRTMAFAPEHLLNRKEALGLTAQQEQRLTQLRDQAKQAHDAAMTDAHTHMEAMQRSGPGDTTGLRQHFQGAHNAMGTAHWAMLRASAQARALLTEEQRGRVMGWVDAMEMMQHRRMQHGPGPEPGHRPRTPSPGPRF